jgi:hypothetical protein
MYFTLPKITASIVMLACLDLTKVAAKESISQNPTDLSFEFIVNSEYDKQYVDICTEAMHRYDNVDEYRFVHSNTIISFQKQNFKINLISAKFLNLRSGKFIQDGPNPISQVFINEKEYMCP